MSRALTCASEADLASVPHVRLRPGSDGFAQQASRLRLLAQGHSLGDFLRFCAELSDAQAAATEAMVPRTEAIPPSFRPLDASVLNDPGWLDALATIMGRLASTTVPARARAGLGRLAKLSQAAVSALAGRILTADFDDLDLAMTPFVAAALQVDFTARAAGSSPADVGTAYARVCPFCGSVPVAGLILGDHKRRYLSCSLCGSEWYLPRLTCVHCASTAPMTYLSLPAVAGVKAECCNGCLRYLKLFYLEERPGAQAMADDLASLALDVLVSDQGYRKAGVNLLLPT